MHDKAKTIIFRADGDSNIGLGHITRLLALAEMLDDSYYKVFATRNSDKSIIESIQEECDKVISLDPDNHLDEFLKLLSGKEIVVLDNYFFTTSYYTDVRQTGCKLVCLDDLGDKTYDADLVINHSPGFEAESISSLGSTKLALGPQFAILRRPFLELARKRNEQKKGNKIFICFGGSDPENFTMRILAKMPGLGIESGIAVVTGKSYPFARKLESYISTKSGIEWYSDLDASGMVKLITQSKIAIVPASSVLFEVLCARVPVICGYYTENQLKTYQGFKSLGAIIDANDFNKLEQDQLASLIREAEYYKTDPVEIIDGQSGTRIAELIYELKE